MHLGVLSMSLAVKDLQKSKTFYEVLGFTQFAGDLSMKYLIMKNGDSLIGLFHGMFDKNIITFNPGWNANAQKLESYKDVREIQKHLQKNDITLETEIDLSTTGPASFVVLDPDGNTILTDQHV